VELARPYVIREHDHRIHNPFDDVKLATLGAALRLPPGASVLDLACGSGELLATWARDHGITGTGVDISTHFLATARRRADELGVGDRVTFVHGDAGEYVANARVDVGACIGATWIGGGVEGTITHLERSLRPGGLVLIGEPYWLKEPPDEATLAACHATTRDEYSSLPELLGRFAAAGWDVVELVLANPDGWDRYHGAQWLSVRRWLDANPDDELAPAFREELSRAPFDHVLVREYLGWGVFALLRR
jgi:SAM-dependent methyltransferase